MTAPSRGVALAGVLVALASLPSRPARAASCCVSATAVGMGRLLAWERFAVGLQSALVSGLGYFDLDGRWRRASAGYRDYQWRSDVWGLVDLTHHLTLAVDLPLILNYRAAGDLGSGVGGGVGDLQAGLRWDVLPVGGYVGRPGFALSLAFTAPTGRATDTAIGRGDVVGAGVTGRGAWVLSAGAVLEKAADTWFVRCGLTLNVPLPMTRADTGASQRFGPGLAALLVAGGRLVEDLTLSGLVRLDWEHDVTLAGAAVPDSWVLDPGVGIALSWRVHPHVTLQASLDTNLFVDWLGHNAPGRVTAALGLRYGHFR